MKIINSHRRIINQNKDKVSDLLESLSTRDDKIWPHENWPRIRFENGLRVGSKGGHGRIRYTIIEYIPHNLIEFQFTKPIGLNGTHEFRVKGIADNKSEVIHNLEMNTVGLATMYWVFAIRWLHDALIEDGFDKIESHFLTDKKKTAHSYWVQFLRYVLKPMKKAEY